MGNGGGKYEAGKHQEEERSGSACLPSCPFVLLLSLFPLSFVLLYHPVVSLSLLKKKEERKKEEEEEEEGEEERGRERKREGKEEGVLV